jgi:hypothetical protein
MRKKQQPAAAAKESGRRIIGIKRNGAGFIGGI